MGLKQATMQLSIPEGKTVPKLVMLHESGLAIHRGKGAYSRTWVISHFNSGRAVLSYIELKEEAFYYIEKLTNICESWDFTLEDFDEGEWKTYLKIKVDKLQKEILEKA